MTEQQKQACKQQQDVMYKRLTHAVRVNASIEAMHKALDAMLDASKLQPASYSTLAYAWARGDFQFAVDTL
jgi:hypothetical protein